MKKHTNPISNPKVSVITPLYNSKKFILETINSVINQTYTHWELILIDDCSTDNTLDIIHPFLSDNIKLIKNTANQGAAISRNKGIMEATGDYIAFLDSDDIWKPEKLEIQIAFMQKHNCDVCFSSYEQIGEDGVYLNKKIVALPKLYFGKLLKSNYIGNLTGIYNVNILGKVTLPNLRKRQDWLLWLMLLKKSGTPALGIQESLAFYRVRKNGISSNKWHLLKYNFWVYKKGLGFSTLKSAWYMLVFLWEHFFVKSRQVVAIGKN